MTLFYIMLFGTFSIAKSSKDDFTTDVSSHEDSDDSSDDFVSDDSSYESNAPKGRKSEKLKRRVTQKVNDQNYIVVFFKLSSVGKCRNWSPQCRK
jgi:hypothetical protein